MDKHKGIMIAIAAGKPKGEPPPLGSPGMKPKAMKGPMMEGGEGDEQSAKDKLAYVRDMLKDCLAAIGDEEEPGEEESDELPA